LGDVFAVTFRFSTHTRAPLVADDYTFDHSDFAKSSPSAPLSLFSTSHADIVPEPERPLSSLAQTSPVQPNRSLVFCTEIVPEPECVSNHPFPPPRALPCCRAPTPLPANGAPPSPSESPSKLRKPLSMPPKVSNAPAEIPGAAFETESCETISLTALPLEASNHFILLLPHFPVITTSTNDSSESRQSRSKTRQFLRRLLFPLILQHRRFEVTSLSHRRPRFPRQTFHPLHRQFSPLALAILMHPQKPHDMQVRYSQVWAQSAPQLLCRNACLQERPRCPWWKSKIFCLLRVHVWASVPPAIDYCEHKLAL
jgi:hypothetical protein